MTLSLDLDAMEPALRYKLLTAVVIPRPVAWVTTVGVDGTVNAAPYSFFNLLGKDRALVILGLEHHADGSAKDTTENIRRTGEFVINIARAVAGRMVGGPGIVAIIASGLTGTISGSAVANTASTGVQSLLPLRVSRLRLKLPSTARLAPISPVTASVLIQAVKR